MFRHWVRERAAELRNLSGDATRGEKEHAWKNTEKHKIFFSRAEGVPEDVQNLRSQLSYCWLNALIENNTGEER